MNNRKINTISLRVDTTLYSALQNYLSAMHNVSNYTFGSVSDLIRHILSKLKEKGLHNDQINYCKSAECTEIVVRISYEEKQFWESLPHRNKRQIVERAISAFVKQGSS